VGRRSSYSTEEVFLFSLPVTATEAARSLAPRGEEALGDSLRVNFELEGEPAQEWRSRFPNLIVSSPNPARITIAPFDEAAQKVTAERREATFVIDYEEPSVQEMLARVPTEERTPPGLEAFVARTLKKTYGRGFDIASRVATLKQGDCTEHAVLLTALLRASGYSARVVVGVVVLLHPETALAAGHAWAEVAEGGLWRRLDAALYRDSSGHWLAAAAGVDPSTLRHMVRLYLATNLLTSEGPNFAQDLLKYAFKFAPKNLTLDHMDTQ